MQCSILLLDSDGEHLKRGAAPGLPEFYNAAIESIAIGAGVGSCGTAAYTGQRVIVEDIATHPYWIAYKEIAAQAGLGACWSEPVISSSGRVLGTFAIYHREKNSPAQSDIYVIEQSAQLARIAIERKLMEEQIRQLALFDMQTNLPNRRLLKDRLSQAIVASKRSNYYYALMFLDLDNFKKLNDQYGHDAGDQLLIEIATRLKSCVRETDTVARFGGDEFIVLLSELDADKPVSTAQARQVAEKIHAALSMPIFLTCHVQPDCPVEYSCTASIGIKMFNHLDRSDDNILKGADAAMYQAKNAGRNLIRFCEQ